MNYPHAAAGPLRAAGMIALSLACASLAGAADSGEPADAAKPAGKEKTTYFHIDMDSPSSPAFAMLGISPANVVRPTTPRDLGINLLSGFDQHSNLQSGLALEAVPYTLFLGKIQNLQTYRCGGDAKATQTQRFSMVRILSRTQVSLATAKGIDSDKAVRAAVGLHVTLFDNGDPRMDRKLLDDFNTLASDTNGFGLSATVMRTLRGVFLAQGTPAWEVTTNPRTGSPWDMSTPAGQNERKVFIRTEASPRADALLKQARAKLIDPEALADQGAYGAVQKAMVDTLAMDWRGKALSEVWDLFDVAFQRASYSRRDANGKLVSTAADFQEALTAAFAKPREEARKRNWNATNWMIGTGYSTVSADGSLNRLRDNGVGLWTTASYGFDRIPGLEHSAQLLVHARMRTLETVQDPADKTKHLTQNSSVLALRAVYGSERANFGLEWGAHRVRQAGSTADNYQTLGGVLEWRLDDKQWINLSLQQTFNQRGKQDTSLMAGFNWGLFNGPQASIQPQ